MKDKMMMRHTILKDIGKAVEEQTKETYGQTTLGLENSKMTEEDDSTSIMIEKWILQKNLCKKVYIILACRKDWPINDLMDFGTLLNHKKMIIQKKVAKGKLNVSKGNKGQQKNLSNPSQMD